MKSLVRFELYKIFAQKGLYIAAILLWVIITFFLLQMKGESLHYLYKKWEGPVTTHDVQTALKKDRVIERKQSKGVDISWEELKLRNVYNDVVNVRRYKKGQNSTIQQINQEMDDLKDQSSYPYRKLQLKKNMIKKIHYQSLYYQKPVAQMGDFLNTYGLVFLGSLILIGLSSIFTQESTTHVDQYMYSSKHGRKTIVHAKITASFIFVLIVALFSVGFDLVFWNLAEGNYGWQADIHSIQKFWDSPYSFNLLSYFFIKAGLQFIAGCAFALFVIFVSALNKNPVVSFLISGFVFAFPIAVETFVPFELPSWMPYIFKFTYTDIMIVDVLFKNFETVDLFGYPILYPIFSISVLVIITAIVLFLLYKVIRNKQVA